MYIFLTLDHRFGLPFMDENHIHSMAAASCALRSHRELEAAKHWCVTILLAVNGLTLLVIGFYKFYENLYYYLL